MVSSIKRWLKHLCTGEIARRRAFGPKVLKAIEQAIHDCEALHPGEVRFAISASLTPAQLLRNMTPRQLAQDAFARLGVWDTEHNNGVLIFVLLADRDVEILADRGVGNGKVPQAAWQHCCLVMQTHFSEGRFEQGAIEGIRSVSEVLAQFPPTRGDVGNEQANKPDLL